MNTFIDTYNLDANLGLAQPTFHGLGEIEEHLLSVMSGSYNDGPIQVADNKTYSSSTIESWAHLVGEGAEPIVFTGWGDFICASYADEAFYLVLPQENHKISLGNLIKGVFDINLANHEFISKLLWAEKFKGLVNHHGPLKYGHCFVHTPWSCLGGAEHIEGYSMGRLNEYLDLIGQHWAND